MEDLKHTPEKSMQVLVDLFSKGPSPCKSSGRTYILESKDSALVFRRDDFCLIFEDAINDVYGPDTERDGNDIVPQKLAKLFPGRSKHDADN